VAVDCKRRELWNLSHGVRRLLSRLQAARRRLPSSMGPVFPLLPHPLHRQMAQLSAGAATLSHVSAGLEVQGIISLGVFSSRIDPCSFVTRPTLTLASRWRLKEPLICIITELSRAFEDLYVTFNQFTDERLHLLGTVPKQDDAL